MNTRQQFQCEGCKAVFKTKVAHNCTGGHWSDAKTWTVVEPVVTPEAPVQTKPVKPIKQDEMTTRSCIVACMRVLNAAGFPKAIRPKYRMFESPEGPAVQGVVISRVGVSRSAALTWYHPDEYRYTGKHGDEVKAICREKTAAMKAILEARGIKFTHGYFIECRYA